MKIAKTIAGLLLIASVGMLCGCSEQRNTTIPPPVVTGKFEFTILKSGKADAVVMQTENYNIVVDVGEKDDGDEISEYLSARGIKNIHYLFITHFDKDHVGGFSEVIENVTASNILTADYEGNNKEYAEYMKTVGEKGLEVTSLTKDISFVLDDVLFEVSVPKKESYVEEDNDFSLAISVTHGENTFLFAGDAEEDRLTEVLSEFGKQYDFLKVPHHGKYNKVTPQFIKTIKPRYAAVTDSDKNPASEKTASLLEAVGSEIYSTRNGGIYVVSNGRKIIINQ